MGGGIRRRLPDLPPENSTMRRLSDRLVALLFVLAIVIAPKTVAQTVDLNAALAHFTANSERETEAGIAALAGSNDPRAIIILQALRDGRVIYSAREKKVVYRDRADALIDAATGELARPPYAIDFAFVRLDDRMRGVIDVALERLGVPPRAAVAARAQPAAPPVAAAPPAAVPPAQAPVATTPAPTSPPAAAPPPAAAAPPTPAITAPAAPSAGRRPPPPPPPAPPAPAPAPPPPPPPPPPPARAAPPPGRYEDGGLEVGPTCTGRPEAPEKIRGPERLHLVSGGTNI
jgi:hypothetical protein